MEHRRHVHPPGQVQLANEHLALLLTGREVVEIIQANLPHGHHTRLRKHPFQLGFRFIRPGPGLVRMHAHRAVHTLMLPGQRHDMAAGFQVAARKHAAPDAGLRHALHHLRKVVLKILALQMTMRIKQVHRISAPSSTPGSTVTSFNVLSCASEAQRIMPSLRIPRSFAGLRLLTRTTCLPTISSGE